MDRQKFNQLLYIAYVLVLSMFAVSCSQMDKRQVYPWGNELLWPAPPVKPRIKYMGYFSDPKEFGISRGFFDIVIDFFTGAEEQHLVRPMAVVAPNEKEIYVADPGARGVHYFNSKENDYRLIQLPGNKPMPSPVGLTIGPDNKILVTDSELGAVFSISKDSDSVKPFYLQYQPKQPTGIVYDKYNKKLYIVDTESHVLNVFNIYGKHLKTIGSRGNGKLQFNFPTMLTLLNKDQLLVTDSLNFRVQRLKRSGKYLSQFGKVGAGSGEMNRPKGVATDSYGHIYIVDSLFHSIQVFDKKGRLLLRLGEQGQGAGQFWLPTGIYINKNNTIYVADSQNRRIQVFRYIGGDT